MNNIKLRDALILMFLINRNKDYECYFSNGKLVVESKIVNITGGYNDK